MESRRPRSRRNLCPIRRRPALLGRLTTSLANCQTDLDYRVEAGELHKPGRTMGGVVHPLQSPKMGGRGHPVIPPAYTRRPTAVQSAGSLRVIEGSDVQFAIELIREPQMAALELGGAGGAAPLTIPLSIQGTKLTGMLPKVTTEQTYTIIAITADGVELDRGLNRIKVQPDELAHSAVHPARGGVGRHRHGRGTDRGGGN